MFDDPVHAGRARVPHRPAASPERGRDDLRFVGFSPCTTSSDAAPELWINGSGWRRRTGPAAWEGDVRATLEVGRRLGARGAWVLTNGATPRR